MYSWVWKKNACILEFKANSRFTVDFGGNFKFPLHFGKFCQMNAKFGENSDSDIEVGENSKVKMCLQNSDRKTFARIC